METMIVSFQTNETAANRLKKPIPWELALPVVPIKFKLHDFRLRKWPVLWWSLKKAVETEVLPYVGLLDYEATKNL